MQGKVVGLYCNKIKGQPAEPTKVLKMEAGQGVCGDRHKGKGDRQVSITSAEIKDWMDKEEEKGLCFNKFKENITIEGIDFETLKIGHILKIGQVSLELTECGKDCHGDPCQLPPTKMPCKLIYSEIFAKVLTSGEIKIGDAVLVDGN